MPPPADIVKVAIEWPGAYPKLMEIDQKKPLSAIIKEVCDGWSLANHEYYALQHADSSNFYITEKNRNEIKNGAILRLTTSPAQNAQQLHERIQSSSMDAKLEALKDLASLSRDVTFAQEFINLDGISLLTQMAIPEVAEDHEALLLCPFLLYLPVFSSFGDMLSFTLTAFVELMDHGIVSWDTFSVAFIKKIASFVNKSAIDISILQRSLAILESMVLNSHDLYQKVAQEITIGQLIPHLQGSDQEIQTYTIAVINALFLKAPDERRQVSCISLVLKLWPVGVESSVDILDCPLTEMANILAQKQLRSIILTHVIRAQRAINNEMAHQLYVLQVLTFNLLEDRMMTKMDPQDQAQRDIIFELRRIAFDAESEPNNSSGSIEKRKSMYTRDYKKLGFIVSKPSPSSSRCLTSVTALMSPLSVWSSCALQNSFHIFQMFSWFKQDHMKISSGCSEME
ncbi:Engulfment and cell motility protein 1 [Galemys pyrenaicus]|uniref:Engulfment and cell motility protein 1 n=1 Tax=Galemys pyrenaicus TaxID=202257 RepID=A0A8J6AM64_GALPY|nr:Engulfment and cell motility protein 1 [Galemys pyrenaicus]